MCLHVCMHERESRQKQQGAACNTAEWCEVPQQAEHSTGSKTKRRYMFGSLLHLDTVTPGRRILLHLEVVE